MLRSGVYSLPFNLNSTEKNEIVYYLGRELCCLSGAAAVDPFA
jgi:hypothetical protein